jgi:hypothetical protein
VDHAKFAEIERNAELVWEVRKRFGPATALIYEAVLAKAEELKKRKGDERAEITVSTMEIALILPDLTLNSVFSELVDPPASGLANGNPKLKRIARRIGYSSDNEDELPQEQINGIYQNDDDLQKKITLVREHLQELSSDSNIFLRVSNNEKIPEDELWTINFLTLQQFVKRTELERIVERKYGGDALRLIKLIEEKTHIDQEQVPSLYDLD